jgi:CheY-like chemotaxis protein
MSDASPLEHSLRILIAEGNPGIQQVIRSLLQQIGYQADSVGEGAEVVKSLQSQSYDLILMAVHLPDMDGITATQTIKTGWNPANCPWIVAMAPPVSPDDLQRMLNAGMDDYIEQPVVMSTLQAVVMRYNESHAFVPLRPAVPPSTVPAAWLDPQAVQQILQMVSHNPEEFLVATIDCYLAEAQQFLDLMKTAVCDRDYAGLARIAHTLKSSSATLGATAFAHRCQALEAIADNALEACPDWERTQQQVAQLGLKYEAVEIALQVERQKYQSKKHQSETWRY